MGVMNHDCVIATTSDSDAVAALINAAEQMGIKPLVITPVNQFGYRTVMLPPDGSKEGWEDSNNGDRMREAFIALIGSFNYSDGSNPFSWVEVSFGERGQKITQGNNKDVMSPCS